MRFTTLLGLMFIGFAINPEVIGPESGRFFFWVLIAVMTMDIVEFAGKLNRNRKEKE